MNDYFTKAQKLSVWLWRNSKPDLDDYPGTQSELFVKRLNMDSLLCRMTDAQLEKVLSS